MSLLTRPLDPFMPHLGDLEDWLPKLMGVGLLAVLGWGIIQVVIRRNRFGLALLGIGLVPLLIEMALLRTFTSRYILFTIPYFVVVASFGVDDLISRFKARLSEVTLVGIMIVLLALWPAYFIYLLHTNIDKVPFPRTDRPGYLEEWTAGTGMKQIADYLDNESKKEPVVVWTNGNFGTLPDGLQIYLNKNHQVAVVGGGLVISEKSRKRPKTTRLIMSQINHNILTRIVV